MDKEQVGYVATLARLALSPEETAIWWPIE